MHTRCGVLFICAKVYQSLHSDKREMLHTFFIRINHLWGRMVLFRFMRRTFPLGEWVHAALLIYSREHPNELVKPELFSCFIHQHRDKNDDCYYPVIRINARENTGDGIVDIHIDTNSFCRNPIGVKSSITGGSLIRQGICGCRYLYCPQLDCDLAYSYNLVANGVLILNMW